MILADGIIDAREMETLYRIGREEYGISQKEIDLAIKESGTPFHCPEDLPGKISFLYQKNITMKKLIFSFIAVATAILVSCNEEFEELTSDYTPNYRDGVYSGDNLTFTVDGEPRTVNSVTISSRQVGNDTLYSDNLKKHYLNPIYVTNVIIKGFPGKKDRITIPAISSVDKLRGCINIYPEYYDCLGKFTGSPLDRHEFQGLELQLISR